MESRSGSKRRYDEVEPRVQRRIVAEYRQGVRGYGYIATAKRLSASCVKIKLGSGEEVKLCRTLEQTLDRHE